MNECYFKCLLTKSDKPLIWLTETLGVTADELSNGPQYAIAYLELYIKHRDAEITREQVREWLL